MDKTPNHKTNTVAANEEAPSRAPLRIGLIVDSFTQPQWIYRIIEALRASTIANITLVLKDDTTAGTASNAASPFQFQHALALAFLALDRKLFQSQLTASTPHDVSSFIEKTPVIDLALANTSNDDPVDEEQATQIQQYQLDVILHFGTRNLHGRILNCAKHGVWMYQHSDTQAKRGGPPGLWEVLEGNPVTGGSALQILSEQPENGRVIYEAFARTIPFSAALNANNSYWHAVDFVQYKLRDLYELPAEGISSPHEHTAFVPYFNRLYTMPTNMQMLGMLATLGRKTIAAQFRKSISAKQWYLAYQIGDTFSNAPPALYKFQSVMPPNDCFWADPFPVKHEGRYYVFFEEYMYATRKAHLSVIEVDQQGIRQPSTIILNKPYHLSYPFIFRWNGDYYMIPESSEDKTIQLYRCVSFPFEWELEKILMADIQAVDTSLMQIDGRWWMFTCIESDELLFSDALHLYYADSPLGPWTAYRRNPVKSDVRNSRPAGNLFRWHGQLYRPAQDGSKRYGYGITINRIDRLDMDGLSETAIAKILPEWTNNLSGVHTLNMTDDFIVVDALRDRYKYF